MQITKQVSLTLSHGPPHPRERITVLYKNVRGCENYSSFKHSDRFGPNICFLVSLLTSQLLLELTRDTSESCFCFSGAGGWAGGGLL
jgi:hypothetical protein